MDDAADNNCSNSLLTIVMIIEIMRIWGDSRTIHVLCSRWKSVS